MKQQEEESVYFSSDQDSHSDNKSKTIFSLITNQTNVKSESGGDQIKGHFAKAIDNLKEKSTFDSKSQLTGRIEEKQKVQLFLANCLNIMGKTSLPSLYVCGVPGIGKTLTILKVTDWFTKQHFGQVKCIYLNGMQMRRVSKVYSVILKKLAKRKSKKPYHYLDLLLTQSKSYPFQQDIALLENKLKLLIVDEIDYFLEEKYQQILFNFLQWTNNSKSKMVLIGLSNTINFVQKLNSKITSRMQISVNLLFQSYSSQEVENILKAKLSKFAQLFNNDSLRLISKMVGTISSDIRSAMHFCQRALTYAMQESISSGKMVLVNQSHIQSLIQPNPVFEILKGLPKIQKIVLLVLEDIRQSHRQDDSLLINSKFVGLCQRQSIKLKGSYHILRQILFDLKDLNLIQMKDKKRWDKNVTQHIYFEGIPIFVSPPIIEFIQKSSVFQILK